MKKSELKSLIAQGQMKTLIKKLEAVSPSLNDDLQDEILLVIGRYKRLKNQTNIGVVSRDDENVESNQMSGAFLALVEKLPEEMEEKTRNWFYSPVVKWAGAGIGFLVLIFILLNYAGPRLNSDGGDNFYLNGEGNTMRVKKESPYEIDQIDSTQNADSLKN